ncbi:hypothetical protein ACFQE1_03465 [Halobium palmae]|uniref:SPW repeat-containing protein n=1 Tax=Halobium palmae TaxID=1776492 RepID=A0ABD5RWB6_9EURY
MVETHAGSLVGGQNQRLSFRFLKVAGITLLLGTLSALLGHLVSESLLTVVGPLAMVLTPIFALLAAYHTYQNQGLAVSWILVFAPLFVMITHGFGVGLFSEPTLIEWFRMGVLQGGGYALVVGTLAFAVGFTARLIVDWQSETA